MKIENNIIVKFDKIDENLIIPKNAEGLLFYFTDLWAFNGFSSIVVEEGNEHFYVQDGCLIWEDKKAVVLAQKGAKIPDNKDVEAIFGGAFMNHKDLGKMVIPSNIKSIGYYAFVEAGLKAVELNEGLETLDLYAFCYNKELVAITVPRSVKKFITHRAARDVSGFQGAYKNTVYCVYKGSYAHRFMQRNGWGYELIGENGEPNKRYEARPIIDKRKFRRFEQTQKLESNEKRRIVLARDMVNEKHPPEDKNGLYCLIGQAQDGSVHFCDILKAPHILVGGCTGTGKSVFLRGVVLSLIINYNPNELGLILLDTKKHCEFVVYDDIPHVVGLKIEDAESELKRRLSIGEGFNERKKIVVIIDEYAELSYDKKTKEIVEKLVQHGHGVGIHVIMATQRVAKDVITPILQDNLSTVVSCAVAEKRDSKFVMGKYGAEKLLGKGDMLYKDSGGTIVRVQSGYVGNQGVQDIVQAIIEKYKRW